MVKEQPAQILWSETVESTRQEYIAKVTSVITGLEYLYEKVKPHASGILMGELEYNVLSTEQKDLVLSSFHELEKKIMSLKEDLDKMAGQSEAARDFVLSYAIENIEDEVDEFSTYFIAVEPDLIDTE